MSRRLPPLNALRAFEAAARHCSFVRAAEELHVTPAAISQQIKVLEDYLGVALFRRGKLLSLSESASAVQALVSEAFDQLERATLKIRAYRDDGPLVVSAPPAFAARWLIPRLDAFHAQHPEVDLRLLATQRLVDFRVEDVDLAIRFGAGDYPDLHAERLMSETIVPIAAPKLAQAIKRPSDLARYTLLEDEWHTANGVFPDWETWLATLQVVDMPLHVQHFGDANLVLQAAVAGLGVTLAWHSLVIDDLKSGRLVRLLDKTIPTTLSYHLVIPHNRTMLGKVVTFRAWLLDQAAKQSPPNQ
jgi:LysR family glycine cleavage system transcriptional activator